ncbi:MAG: helix-turn-helix domain-containing protein [Desulfovibrionaceae bacterium]|nr:helix-turn-helix domain-containing protein [Desulfovibrionaceae bacterium]
MKKIITDNTFGQNLQKIRLAKGLTQEQTVAKLQLLGSPLTRGTYSLIEMGRGNIYISDLVGLKQIFNIGYAEFFDGVLLAR